MPTQTQLTAPPKPHETPWTLNVLDTPDAALVVFGKPAPQGSKNGFAVKRTNKATGAREYTGKVAMTESSKGVAPWRAGVASIARTYVAQHPGFVVLDGPLIADMVFTWPRPQATPRWNIWPTTYPDLSKLARSTEDALTKILWADDSKVIAYRRLEKVYVGADDPDTLSQPGVVIRVWRLPNWMIEERRTFASRSSR